MTDDRWTAGYAAAKRYYGDTAPLALDKIRGRLNDFTDQYGVAIPDTTPLGRLLHDLTDILDTAKEHHA